MRGVPDDIERRREELDIRQLEQVSRLADRLAEAQRREQRIPDGEDVSVRYTRSTQHRTRIVRSCDSRSSYSSQHEIHAGTFQAFGY